MLTSRGLWFLVWLLALLGVSLWANVPTLALVCLTLLFWLLGSWLAFLVQLRLLAGRLRVERRVSDERGTLQSLWAGRAYRVRVALHSDRSFPSPYLRVTDRVPYGAKRLSGDIHMEGSVAADASLSIEYFLYCLAPGTLRFEGVAVQVADPQGLFYQDLFLQDVSRLRVLPPLADARGHVPTVKRHNVIPLLGAHRLRRPGSGSELLDLREYLPGDPPKTIAWKVSARRNRLMTKEFESEVPVRATLFMDTSQSVRVGSPVDCPLTRLVEISAAVAQAMAGARDLAGLCLCDERVTHYVRPARGPRHLVKLMGLLADAAGLPAAAADVPVAALLPLAYSFARETYPQLLADDVNAFPLWLPLLSPQPAYTLPQPPLRARSLLFRPWVWLRLFLRRLRLGLRQGILARLSPHTHLHYRWRKQLAALLSVHYGLAPGGLALLLEDDRECVQYLQRFLAEHHVPYQLPLYDLEGRYLFAAPGKVAVLARALVHAVARGRDNELFVLLADLLEIGEHLGPLLRAVKVALARHHQVLLVCPWPAGVPLPPRQPEGGALSRPDKGRKIKRLRTPEALILRTTTRRLHRAYHQLRRTFGRLGVSVLCARQDDSVRLILDRLERLRTQRRGVR
jgi:uncharacterized protein (DUF58 family)